MEIINKKTTLSLGRDMPPAGLFAIAQGEHSAFFGVFAGVDVWTKSGWLITSISGEFCQVRKGDEVGMQKITAETVVYCAKNPDILFSRRGYVSRPTAQQCAQYC